MFINHTPDGLKRPYTISFDEKLRIGTDFSTVNCSAVKTPFRVLSRATFNVNLTNEIAAEMCSS